MPINPSDTSPPSYRSVSPPSDRDAPTIPSTAAALKDIPSDFLIGSSNYPALISGPSVLAHLRLLGAFHALEASVYVPASDPADPPGAVRWRVFIHQAVWRFEIWLKRVVKPGGATPRTLRDEEIPPLDVLLVWHAYLLNPRVYADDATRAHPELAALGGLPLERVAAQIDPATLAFAPTPAQAAFWENTTLAPREPLSLSLASRDELAVECPRCEGPPVQVAWLQEPCLASDGHALGTGWCQNQFRATCGCCGFQITRESIAVGRFAADIAAALVDTNAILPGTLFDPIKCVPSAMEARLITTLLLQPFRNLPPLPQAIGEHLSWSFSGIEASIVEARDTLVDVVRAKTNTSTKQKAQNTDVPSSRGTGALAARIIAAQEHFGVVDIKQKWLALGPRIAKMLASYRDNPSPFTIDLVGAILRQTTFTAKASALGWLDPTNTAPPLSQSITRYHRFLHLLARFPGTFLVPTLDIDLGWHTHQLSGKAYLADTHACVGRYVDHDDTVEEGVLSDGFDTTSRMYESTFHAPYSACAPTHAHTTLLEKLKKLARHLTASDPADNANDAAPAPALAPDLTTYPSEHPSVLVVQGARIAARQRMRRPSGTGDAPFMRNMRGPRAAGVVPIAFGAMGLTGWALRGDVDPRVVDAAKGQCCAGYYADPDAVALGALSAGGCGGEADECGSDASACGVVYTCGGGGGCGGH